MSYKLVKVTTYYKDYLQRYYSQHPSIISLSYDEQHKHLMSQAYGWSDYYAKHLRTLGVDAYEIVANAEPMQKKWAEENKLQINANEIVLEQIKKFKPDVVFMQDSTAFNGNWVKYLKENVSSIKIVIGWCCSPFSKINMDNSKAFDFMFVCSKKFYEEFRQLGMEAYELHHAFESSLLPRIKENNNFPITNFIFIGSLIPGSGFHDLRKQVIEYIIDSGIEYELYANITYIKPIDLAGRKLAYLLSKVLKAFNLNEIALKIPKIGKVYSLKEMPQNLPGVKSLIKKAKPSLYALDMFKALHKAKIAFNLHGQIAGDYAANVRMFEITGVGSCLLTDWKKNITELFEPDKEIITYNSAQECTEKIKWLLDHPSQLTEISKAGQQRTLNTHNYYLRASLLNEIIVKKLGNISH